MEELIKILQEYQLDALRYGATCTLNTNYVNTTLTEVTFQVFYSEVVGTDFVDHRDFRAAFSSTDEKESKDAKLKALNKFIYSISK